MKKTLSSLVPAYPISDYLLVLEPTETVHTAIMHVKKQFAETYDCPAAAYSKPHITLIRFQQYDMQEKRIVHQLQRLIKERNAFMIELNDFGSFPTHTIYVNVTTKVQIVELVRSLRPAQALMKMDKDHKAHFITEPHITVARKLLPWQYEKGWLELSNTHFTAKFMANHVLLLRKRMDSNRYEAVQRFVFENIKETVTQTTLFT